MQDQLEKEAEAALQARQNPAPEKPSRPVNEQKKKLTFKERKEFEALEEEIPALEAEKAELETAMSSGTFSTDHPSHGRDRRENDALAGVERAGISNKEE